jgi:redox-sensitive bicupin YhaK (pirin superfamily)
MNPQQLLAQSATLLDDAIEYLTFERFDWAFDNTWRGVAGLLVATSSGGAAAPVRREPDENLAPGSLLAMIAQVDAPPQLKALVHDLEALRSSLATDSDVRDAAVCDEIARLVFDASSVLAQCAAQRGLLDPGAVYGAMAGPVEPAVAATRAALIDRLIPRRSALKLLAAGGFATLAACVRAERTAQVPARSGESAPPAAPAVPAATVRAVTSIDAMQWPTSDPFLFCAYHVDDYPAGNAELGPAASLEGRQLGRDFDGRDNWRMYHGEIVPGFPRHPHRGFETVTVVRTGLLDHADSLGATARYGGGDVQWLTAGGGIQHAEMFPLLRSDAANPLELFQIWLNLPARDKMVDPYFTMLWSEQIPRIVERDSDGRVVEITISAGTYNGQRPPPPPPNSWASRPESDLAIWTLRMEAGARFELPAVAVGTDRSVYLHRGNGARVAGADVANSRRVEFDGNGPITIEAGSAEVEILLLQGRPIGEPIARRGPFVMNNQDEIRQAYADYQATQFGGWPWPANGPVHDRSRGRFARHIDGRHDEPT